jgi:phosphomevalonate kinase
VANFFSKQKAETISLSPLDVRSDGFQIARRKIGLGSSAAVAAAACGAHFELSGCPIEKNRKKILEIASAAHRAAQGGKGSGGDVAASVLGGTLIFTTEGRLEAIDTQSVIIVPVWSGYATSTSFLLGKINEFKRKDPLGYESCLQSLTAVAAELAAAYRTRIPESIISATIRYGTAMGELGRASGAPIITKELRLAAQLAFQLSGGAKPSGAGGGDVAVAVFADLEAASLFRSVCIRYGLVPLDVSLDAPGLRRDKMQSDAS